MTEQQLLVRFWSRAADGRDRLELLRHYAGLTVLRPRGWNRQAARDITIANVPVECFCCRHRGRVMVWHHILQVQHGGSSSPVNIVGLCELCHARIHPWLPQTTRLRGGFVPVRELMKPFIAWLERLFERSA